MKLQHFRILIINDLFKKKASSFYLISIFGRENKTILFNSGGQEHFYRCEKKDGNIIVGVWGKRSQKDVHQTPELAVTNVDDWIDACCFLFIEGQEGQEIQIEIKPSFSGNNLKVLKDFLHFMINQKEKGSDIPNMEANPIEQKKEGVWDVIGNNTVGSLSITAFPPNFFGHETEMPKAAKEAQDKYNADRLQVTLQSDSKQGLRLDKKDGTLKQNFKQVGKGGGSLVLKNEKNKKIYDSSDPKNIKTTELKDIDNAKRKNNVREFLMDLLIKIKNMK